MKFQDIISKLKDLAASIRNLLIAGILLAVPLVVTIWVLNFIFVTIATVSKPILAPILEKQQRSPDDYLWLSFGFTIILFLTLGLIATNMLGKKLIAAFEGLLMRVPLVATVYSGIKQVIESVQGFKSGMQFQRVAYVDYPAPGCQLIGFVTGQFVEPQTGREMTCIFLPTAPNPMTGFVTVVQSENVRSSSLTLEEATKIIISAGLVGPKPTALAETSMNVPVPRPDLNGQVIVDQNGTYVSASAKSEDSRG